MSDNFKNIHIGKMIEKRVIENGIESSRVCRFLKCSQAEILEMYNSNEVGTEILLRWSKLLNYDFFRLYTQHLILYAPQEIIDFVLDLLKKGIKTKAEIIDEYRIPKTTLYKWVSKNAKNSFS